MRAALHRIMQAIETLAMRSAVECETLPAGIPPLTPRSGDEEIDSRVRVVGATWYFPAGTATMGKVVDAELRVGEVRRLRVVDMSVFLVPVATHYRAVIYAAVERESGFYLGV